MAAKTTGDPTLDALYTVRRGRVAFVDVPELGFVMIDGHGAPDDAAFTNAIHALYSVSYGAHFALKKATGEAPAVMALEAVWWVEGTEAQRTMESVATGAAGMETSDRSEWHWRAMIMQLPPINDVMVAQSIAAARDSKDRAAVDALRYERWTEGPSAQIMHIGPYATEQTSIIALHTAIADNGLRPRGRHHEIYLGDPRRAAPEKLRTILRQPVAPAP